MHRQLADFDPNTESHLIAKVTDNAGVILIYSYSDRLSRSNHTLMRGSSMFPRYSPSLFYSWLFYEFFAEISTLEGRDPEQPAVEERVRLQAQLCFQFGVPYFLSKGDPRVRWVSYQPLSLLGNLICTGTTDLSKKLKNERGIDWELEPEWFKYGKRRVLYHCEISKELSLRRRWWRRSV
jgi:hypothetical protein